MSYPRTQFTIVNNTSVEEMATNVVSGATAIILAAYTSDKGTEDWEMLYGLTDFTTRKGGLNFSKHGQPQFTIANLLANGSYVLAKRMVSEDATLANVTIRARVIQVEGVSYLYMYGTSAENKKTFKEVCEAGYNNFDPEAVTNETIESKDAEIYDIPLFTIATLGRGTSNLTFRLVPEYYASRTGNYMKYSFEVSENVNVLESITCTFNPNAIIDGTIQSIQNKLGILSGQVKAKIYEDGILKLTQVVSKTTSEGIADLINLDYINGYDKRENPIAGIITKSISDKSVKLGLEAQSTLWESFKPSDLNVFSLDVAEGIRLSSGSNGSIGDCPMNNKEEYKKLLLGTFGKNTQSCNFNPVIYDVDRYKVDAIFDCNYDVEVKNAIIDVVDFRGDCVFLADLGVGLTSTEEIISAAASITKSKYVALYHNSFEIVDQFTKKNITVTMPYLLAPKLVDHISTGVGRAFAGISNNLVFPEIVQNTINMIPIVIPGLDQKQILADNNINYLSYYDDLPVMESMWTNDNEISQLSYLHNVMSVQEIIKIIRTRCPKTRYTFLDGDDLEEYLSDANSIIKEYKSNFKFIEMTYMADEKYESNNIFYAVIKVQFHNFVNEEYFKVIAID